MGDQVSIRAEISDDHLRAGHTGSPVLSQSCDQCGVEQCDQSLTWHLSINWPAQLSNVPMFSGHQWVITRKYMLWCIIMGTTVAGHYKQLCWNCFFTSYQQFHGLENLLIVVENSFSESQFVDTRLLFVSWWLTGAGEHYQLQSELFRNMKHHIPTQVR